MVSSVILLLFPKSRVHKIERSHQIRISVVIGVTTENFHQMISKAVDGQIIGHIAFMNLMRKDPLEVDQKPKMLAAMNQMAVLEVIVKRMMTMISMMTGQTQAVKKARKSQKKRKS